MKSLMLFFLLIGVSFSNVFASEEMFLGGISIQGSSPKALDRKCNQMAVLAEAVVGDISRINLINGFINKGSFSSKLNKSLKIYRNSIFSELGDVTNFGRSTYTANCMVYRN